MHPVVQVEALDLLHLREGVLGNRIGELDEHLTVQLGALIPQEEADLEEGGNIASRRNLMTIEIESPKILSTWVSQQCDGLQIVVKNPLS